MKTPHLLQILRQEKVPLALIGLLAVSLRIFVVMLFLSDPANATGLQGIFCNPLSPSGETLPASKDPLKRACSTLCCTWADQAFKLPSLEYAPPKATAQKAAAELKRADVNSAASKRPFSIRAPPVSFS